jgi:hypothetical protein
VDEDDRLAFALDEVRDLHAVGVEGPDGREIGGPGEAEVRRARQRGEQCQQTAGTCHGGLPALLPCSVEVFNELYHRGKHRFQEAVRECVEARGALQIGLSLLPHLADKLPGW